MRWGLFAAVAALLFVVVVSIADGVSSSHEPAVDTISDLVHHEAGAWVTLVFVVHGAGDVALGWVGWRRGWRIAPGLIAVNGGALVALAAFPADPQGATSWVGDVHIVLASLAFACLAAGIVWWTVREPSGIAIGLACVGVGGTVGLAVVLTLDGPWLGVWERVAAHGNALWVAWTGWRLRSA